MEPRVPLQPRLSKAARFSVGPATLSPQSLIWSRECHSSHVFPRLRGFERAPQLHVGNHSGMPRRPGHLPRFWRAARLRVGSATLCVQPPRSATRAALAASLKGAAAFSGLPLSAKSFRNAESATPHSCHVFRGRHTLRWTSHPCLQR